MKRSLLWGVLAFAGTAALIMGQHAILVAAATI